jgi:hypothetical protein
VSVAEPEKEIVSPTFQVTVAAGLAIVALGGVLFALMVSGRLTLVLPRLSPERRRWRRTSHASRDPVGRLCPSASRTAVRRPRSRANRSW